MRASLSAALSFFLGVQSVAASAELFSLTCSDLALDGTVLKAQCNTDDKSAVPANIDLDKIIEAKDGKLSVSQAASLASSLPPRIIKTLTGDIFFPTATVEARWCWLRLGMLLLHPVQGLQPARDQVLGIPVPPAPGHEVLLLGQ